MNWDNPIEDLDDIVEANNCFNEFTKLVNVLKKCHVELKEILGDEYAERFPDIETIYGKKCDFSKTIKARGRAIKRHLNEEAEHRALDRENRNREFELNVKRQEVEHTADLEAKRLLQARELGEKRLLQERGLEARKTEVRAELARENLEQFPKDNFFSETDDIPR